MSTMFRQRQHERQRSEMSYQGSWGFQDRDMTKYKPPKETPTERRWYGVLLACLVLFNVAILVRLAFILWK